MKCDRCSNETNGHVLSMFNTQTLCFECKDDEKEAPGYKYACEREAKEVMQGNHNFEGVGLSVIDITYLAAMRADRKEKGVKAS